MTRVPGSPFNVPVNVPVSLAMNEPSGWIISEPCAIRVPTKLPVRVAVSLTVMIVLPPAVVTARTRERCGEGSSGGCRGTRVGEWRKDCKQCECQQEYRFHFS